VVFSRIARRPNIARSPSFHYQCAANQTYWHENKKESDGHLKRIVDLNAEISNCAFKFGMAK